jgi:hypothetical protein
MGQRRTTPGRHFLSLLPIALFALSLILPFDVHHPGLGQGLEIFVMTFGTPWWLANPLLWVGCLLLYCGRPGFATLCGLIASTVASWASVNFGELAMFSAPCYCAWLSSMISLALGAAAAASLASDEKPAALGVEEELAALHAEIAELRASIAGGRGHVGGPDVGGESTAGGPGCEQPGSHSDERSLAEP